MSDNNQNKNRMGGKDNFVKPGDENIVSGGKPFFLSFGKQKKGPANPLIESEKNKNAKAVTENKPAQKQDNNRRDNRNDEKENKNNPQKNNGQKHGRNDRQNGNRNKNRDKMPQNAKSEEKRAGNPENARTDKNKPMTAPEQKKQNVPAEIRENKEGNEGRNHKNDKKRNRRRNDKRKGAENVKAPETTPELKKGHDESAAHTTDNAADKNRNFRDKEKKNPIPVKEEKGARQRPKHKKEKFVPTAPVPEKEEELLQPIVDRAGIIGKGSSLRQGRTSFDSNSSTISSSKEEPRYIDRNRPLAEQIAEQSKPKTYKNHVTENAETVEVIGVRFREAGKVYYFDPAGNKVAKDQAVIVETARGVEYGFCAIANRNVSVDNIVPPLKSIIRIATADDTERFNSNKQLEAGAAKIFREKVRQLGLDMSLVYVEYTFDNGKLLFYFTADGRVDFRELIKELAASFRTRIELRQIVVRDEAKIVGGLGICGRPVCCKSFLGEFSQVSIKMAKDQNLFINSSKISGTCGRFMCCIRYEDEVYQKEYERTPRVDAMVETPDGKGVVVESNALKGIVKVLLDDKPEEIAKQYKCTEVKLLGYLKKNDKNEIPDDAEELPEE